MGLLYMAKLRIFLQKPKDKIYCFTQKDPFLLHANDYIIMSSNSKRRNPTSSSVWVAIVAIALIILLIIWLTVADFSGDTDVAAAIAPIIEPPM